MAQKNKEREYPKVFKVKGFKIKNKFKKNKVMAHNVNSIIGQELSNNRWSIHSTEPLCRESSMDLPGPK